MALPLQNISKQNRSIHSTLLSPVARTELQLVIVLIKYFTETNQRVRAQVKKSSNCAMWHGMDIVDC